MAVYWRNRSNIFGVSDSFSCSEESTNDSYRANHIHRIFYPGWGIILAFVIETLYTQNNCAYDDLDCQEGIADGMRESSFKVAAGCVGLMATVIVGNVLLYLGFGTASERMNKRVRDAAFESLVRQEIAWYDLRPAGLITSELQDDAALIHSFSGEPIRTVIMTLASLFVGIIISFIFMW